MSAKPATIETHKPAGRPHRKPSLTYMAGAIAVALGLGVLLAGGSASDVSLLSDALGVPVETDRLPSLG